MKITLTFPCGKQKEYPKLLPETKKLYGIRCNGNRPILACIDTEGISVDEQFDELLYKNLPMILHPIHSMILVNTVLVYGHVE